VINYSYVYDPCVVDGNIVVWNSLSLYLREVKKKESDDDEAGKRKIK
jgi:hypothetical protein